ncbi:uncharacterized protein LOC106670873 [Cimex lectularius]|uniref:Uncharacterized protein n=1 Tax=Cimex lectularius TaxID=79782 RepID=A0A8I6S6H5_CIMLE|nr:uncharacterized protein LOC106670873 [Cimex lectularius]
MNGIYFFVAAFLCVQCLADHAPSYQELLKDGQKKFEMALENVKKDLGLPDHLTGSELTKVFHDYETKVDANLKETFKKFEKHLKDDKMFQENVKKLKETYHEQMKTFKKHSPQLGNSVEKLVDATKHTYDALVKEASKNYEEFRKPGGGRDELDKLLTDVFDHGLKLVEELRTNVQKLSHKA